MRATKCKKCKGTGYLAVGARCPKCQDVAFWAWYEAQKRCVVCAEPSDRNVCATCFDAGMAS